MLFVCLFVCVCVSVCVRACVCNYDFSCVAGFGYVAVFF